MALVQEWEMDAGGGVTNPSALDQTVNTFSGDATTTGNFLHLTVTVRDADETVSISDNADNDWQQVPSTGAAGDPAAGRVWHFYCVAASSTTTITITRGTGGTPGQAFLREFDDPISALADHNGAANEGGDHPPPCEVDVTGTGVLIIGSIHLLVTSRILTLQNTGDFTDLDTYEANSLETYSAYGYLDTGSHGPDWDVTTGSLSQYTGSLTSAFTATARPTADAGPDQQVSAGTEGVQLAGTPGDGGGAGAPYVHTWRIISDTTGGATLSSTSTEDPTLDMGPNAGSVTLGYKVTDDDDVESVEDTVVVTALGASNTSVPISDAVVAGWEKVPSGASTNASVVADLDLDTYTVYIDPDGTVVHEFALSAWPSNLSPTDTITVRYRPAQLGFSSVSAVLSIKEGASTTIANFDADVWTVEELPQSFAHTLSSAQISAISDPTNLRARVEYTGTE